MKKSKFGKCLYAVIAIILAVTMFAPSAGAYTYTYEIYKIRKTDRFKFKLYYDLTGYSRTGFANGCARWNDAVKSKVNNAAILSMDTATSGKTGFSQKMSPDGENVLYKEDLPSIIVPGFTRAHKYQDPITKEWYISEADILINVAFNFVNSTSPTYNYYDTETVMVHELGHVMGLGHPMEGSEYARTGSSVMIAEIGKCKRTLDFADKREVLTCIIT